MKKIVFSLVIVSAFLVGRAFAQDSAAQFPAQVQVLPTVVPTVYSTPPYSNGKALREFEVINGLNCDIYLSFNNTTDEYLVVAGTTKTFKFAELGVTYGGPVAMRKKGACTTGTLTFQGMY